MSELTAFKEEYDSLVQVMERVENKCLGTSPSTLNRQGALLHLVRSLQQFAKGQFQFFYQGFGGQPRTEGYPSLIESIEYPPQHVLARVLAQISEDVNLIERIAEQRLGVTAASLRKSSPKGTGNYSIGDILLDYDKLAMTAILPNGLPANASSNNATATDGTPYTDFDIKTAITYFNKAVDVRVIPYSQVALVGIPYTSLQNPLVLMAIPHEVGHWKFWHSVRQGERCGMTALVGNRVNLRELFYPFEFSNGLTPWVEEIFADVYGTLIGGPLSAISAQDMALNSSLFAFANFDSLGEHPTPILRPLVHIKAIKAFSSALSSVSSDERKGVAEQLFNRWKDKLKDRGILDTRGEFVDSNVKSRIDEMTAWTDELVLGTRANGKLYPVDWAIQKACTAIEYAFQSLLPNSMMPQLDWGWSKSNEGFTYSSLIGTGTRIINLEGNADKLLNVLYKTTSASLLQEDNTESLEEWDENENSIPKIWSDWMTKGGKYYVDSAKLNSGETLEAGLVATDMDPKNISYPLNRWIRVFGAGGWTTEGPCSVPPQ